AMRAPFVRGVRGRLLLAVLAAVAVALIALTAAFNVVLARMLDRNANDLLRARATAELAILRPVGDRLTLGEAPDDAAVDKPVWVFANGRTLEKPAGASASIDAAARSLAAAG